MKKILLVVFCTIFSANVLSSDDFNKRSRAFMRAIENSSFEAVATHLKGNEAALLGLKFAFGVSPIGVARKQIIELETPEETVLNRLRELSATQPTIAQEAWDLVPKGRERQQRLTNARKIFSLLNEASKA